MSLGFAASNRFVFNILNDLDTENAGGLTFEVFLKLATGKIGETHTQEEINNVFKSFDFEKKVHNQWCRARSLLNSLSKSLRNWERVWLTNRWTKFSWRRTLIRTDTSLLKISTQLWLIVALNDSSNLIHFYCLTFFLVLIERTF